MEAKSPSSFFTSRRERRLWFLTLAAVVGIYATLGLANTLAEVLRDEGLIETAGFFALFLIVASVLILGLKTRPGVATIGISAGIVAVYVLMFFRMTISPAERTHLMEYTVVALLIFEALTERSDNGRRVRFLPLIAIGGTVLLGAIDEGIQALIPSRVFDPIDILFNTLAGVMTVLACLVLRWARSFGGRLFSNSGD